MKYEGKLTTEIYIGNKLINYYYIKDEKKEIIKPKVNKTKIKKGKFSFPFQLITKANLLHILKFLLKLYNELKPDSIKVDLTIALSDPYYNGLILANYYSMKRVYPNLPVSISTCWDREVIEGQGKIKGKIKPIVIIFLALKFILSPQTLKILWQNWKN